MTENHNNAARVFVAYVNGVLAGFISVIHQPHNISKNLKRVHRLVILPDYQGAGIGKLLLDAVGDYFIEQNYRYIITTSTPALCFALKKNKKWICTSIGRKEAHGGFLYIGSSNRITTSWEKIVFKK